MTRLVRRVDRKSSRRRQVAGRLRPKEVKGSNSKEYKKSCLAVSSFIVSIVALVAAFLVDPVNDWLRDRELAKRPALVATVREAWIDGYDGWTWYFPDALSPEEVESLEEQ